MTKPSDRAREVKAERWELLLFRVGHERFALHLAAVEEAIDRPEVHRLPEMPRAVLGVFSHRDRMLPVYSPAAPLGVRPATDAAVVLVMRSGDDRIGLAIDDVEDVIMLEPNVVRQPPVPDTVETVLVGVARHGEELVGVVDAAALVSACTLTAAGVEQ